MKEYDFFVGIFTDGIMSLEEIRNEAQVQNWAPVLVLKTENGIVVPLFRDYKTCFNFMKRNAPKGQLIGIMGMSEVDTSRFTDKGWKIDWHTYPKLYTNRPGFEIAAEVIESDFNLYVKGRR